jgi:hypothetical protein
MITYAIDKSLTPEGKEIFKISTIIDDHSRATLAAMNGVNVNFQMKDYVGFVRFLNITGRGFPNAREPNVKLALRNFDKNDNLFAITETDDLATALGWDEIKRTLSMLPVYANMQMCLSFNRSAQSLKDFHSGISVQLKTGNPGIMTFLKARKPSTLRLQDNDGNSVEVKMEGVSYNIGNLREDVEESEWAYMNTAAHITAIRNNYANSLETLKSSIDTRIAKMQSSSLMSSFELAKKLITSGWSIEGSYLVNPTIVYAKRISIPTQMMIDRNIQNALIGSSSSSEMQKLKKYVDADVKLKELDRPDTDIAVPLPKSFQERFYIRDFRMSATSSKIEGVEARGYHPHRSSSSRGDEGRYANLCLGSLSGKPISEIHRFVPMYETIYKRSMYGVGDDNISGMISSIATEFTIQLLNEEGINKLKDSGFRVPTTFKWVTKAMKNELINSESIFIT